MSAGLDGVLVGQPALDRLLDLLDLERIEEDIFRGNSPAEPHQRVFGGQVAGQALVAVGRTVPPERQVHSLHAYFIRPGDPAVPIVYTVDRIRDGSSFTTRRVVAVQHGKAIFLLSASFQVPEAGMEHQSAMPAVPDPETLPTLGERLVRQAGGPRGARLFTLPRPIDIRYVTPPPWEPREAATAEPRNLVWIRADGKLPDDPLVQVCALTFASDMTLLDSALVAHGKSWQDVFAASLDHAMWFHHPFRADEWILYDSSSPAASGGRGLALGRLFSRDGRHIATVVQEGLLRERRTDRG
jgi:acyl-CoA thioesterase II